MEARALLAGTATFSSGVLTIIGSASNDTLTVQQIANQLSVVGIQINAGGGLVSSVDAAQVSQISITGLGGKDTIALKSAGAGGLQDITIGAVIDGGIGNDTVTGGASNDSITGGAGNDSLNGSGGNDVLDGGEGDDKLNGGAGDDQFVFSGAGALGADTIIKGDNQGANTLDFRTLQAAITKLDVGTATVQTVNAKLKLTIASNDAIDNVFGTEFGDKILGNGLGNQLLGGGGNDTLTGKAGNDSLDGGEGTDTLSESTTANLTLTPNLLTGAGNDALSSVEMAYLQGSAGVNKLDASSFEGSVTLDGSAGNDILSGGSGNDCLLGGTGADSLDGGLGADKLIGGSGKTDADTLVGGGGDSLDSFIDADGNTHIKDRPAVKQDSPPIVWPKDSSNQKPFPGFDRDKFFAAFTDAKTGLGEKLTDAKRQTLSQLLTFIENDPDVPDIRWIAYMLATIRQEAGPNFAPVNEVGGASKPYAPYFGRGYVQVTWQETYADMGNVLGMDLVAHPEMANDPATAYQILSYGMRTGFFNNINGGTRQRQWWGLKDYLNDSVSKIDGKSPYYFAREMVNFYDTKTFQTVATNAQKFETILKASAKAASPDQTVNQIRRALRDGAIKMTGDVVKNAIGDKLGVDVPLLKQSVLDATHIWDKFAAPFQNAENINTLPQLRAESDLPANPLDELKAELQGAGFDVSDTNFYLSSTPDSQGDLLRLRYRPASIVFDPKLDIGGTAGFNYFDDRVNGSLSGNLTSTPATVSIDVTFGVDLVNGQPTFFIADSTGLRVSNFGATGKASGKMAIKSLASVTASGDFQASLSGGVFLVDPSGNDHKLRVDDLGSGLRGSINGFINLTNVQFAAALPLLPDPLKWSGSFTATINNGDVSTNFSLNAPNATDLIKSVLGNFSSLTSGLPFSGTGTIGESLDTELPFTKTKLKDKIPLGEALTALARIKDSAGSSIKDLILALNKATDNPKSSYHVKLLPEISDDVTSDTPNADVLRKASDLITKLINGEHVDLIRFETQGGDQWSTAINSPPLVIPLPPLPVTVNLSAGVEPFVGWTYFVGAGFDTTGFYIDNRTSIAVYGGVNANLTGSVAIAGFLDVASLTVGAGIRLEAGLKFNDPDPSDGRLYFDEIFNKNSDTGPLDSFLHSLTFYAQGEVTAHAVAKLNLWPLPTITLLNQKLKYAPFWSTQTEQHAAGTGVGGSYREISLVPENAFNAEQFVQTQADSSRWLILTGTANDDSLRLAGNSGTVSLTWFGKGMGEVQNISKVIFRGFDGNDGLDVANSFDVPIDADGGTGNDQLAGGAAADTLKAGGGDDELIGQDGNDVLEGGDGNDKISGGSGLDTLRGGDGLDELQGDADNDLLEGGDKSDRLDGGIGDDTLLGQSGPDVLNGGGNNDSLDGGTDADLLYGDDGRDTLRGGEGVFNDQLYGGSGNDSLDGGAGDDLLQGGDNNDTADGGIGKDVLRGDAGDDCLQGGEGEDSLEGGDGGDILNGGRDNDSLNGNAGADNLYGDAGQDTLVADLESGTGNAMLNDTFAGGTDLDTLWIEPAYPVNDQDQWELPTSVQPDRPVNFNGSTGNNWLIVTQNSGTDEFTVQEKDVITSNLIASLNFTLSAGSDSDLETLTIAGLDGNDTIEVSANTTRNLVLDGGDGNDTLIGGAGNDVLWGHVGEDSLIGNAGADELHGGTEKDFLNGGEGGDRLYGDDGDDQLNGGDDSDSLRGASDIQFGGRGADRIDAGLGFFGDIIYGDDETVAEVTDIWNPGASTGYNDSVTGGEGADVIFGDGGNDSLDGRGLNDVIMGGAGEDTIRGGWGADFLFGGDSRDTIYAFTNDAQAADQYTDRDWEAERAVLEDRRDNLENDFWAVDAEVDAIDILDGIEGKSGDQKKITEITESGKQALLDWFANEKQLLSVLKSNGQPDKNELRQIKLHTTRIRVWDGLDGVLDGQDGATEDEDGLPIYNHPELAKLEIAQLPSFTNLAARLQEQVPLATSLDNSRAFLNALIYNLPSEYQSVVTDLVAGEEGADELYGTEFADKLFGGSGNDTIHHSTGNDGIVGGEGTNDTYVVDGTEAAETVLVRAEKDTTSNLSFIFNVNGQDTATISLHPDIETISFDAKGGDDTLSANFGTNALKKVEFKGGDGKDSITVTLPDKLYDENGNQLFNADGSALQSKATLLGGIGDDTLIGGLSDDSLDGGDGNDLLQGGDGLDTLIGGSGDDKLYGGESDDLLIGGGLDLQSNRVDTQSGKDELHGNGGNDKLFGGDADDLLYGEDGNDTLDGGDDTDYLDATGTQPASDRLYYSGGNDTYSRSGSGQFERLVYRAAAGDSILVFGSAFQVNGGTPLKEFTPNAFDAFEAEFAVGGGTMHAATIDDVRTEIQTANFGWSDGNNAVFYIPAHNTITVTASWPNKTAGTWENGLTIYDRKTNPWTSLAGWNNYFPVSPNPWSWPNQTGATYTLIAAGFHKESAPPAGNYPWLNDPYVAGYQIIDKHTLQIWWTDGRDLVGRSAFGGPIYRITASVKIEFTPEYQYDWRFTTYGLFTGPVDMSVAP